jgi:hypothetical protein
MSGAIPPLPQHAFMVWCSVKAQGQLYLYLSKDYNSVMPPMYTVNLIPTRFDYTNNFGGELEGIMSENIYDISENKVSERDRERWCS